MAEIGLVGKAPNKYNLLLGGNTTSTRLNREYRSGVTADNLIAELRPVLARWRDERHDGEGFGDYCHRVILSAPQADGI